MTPLTALALALVGFVAGVANTLAGGGSLLAVPMLIFVGLPATVANATTRPAIIVQNVFAVFGFARGGAYERAGADRPLRDGFLFAALTLPGALAGAFVAATRISDVTFERVLAAVMVLVGVLTLRRRAVLGAVMHSRPGPRRWLAPVLFFAIGFYGGFIQAGVGFLIMATLLSARAWSAARVNAVKVLIVGVYTTLALVVFAGTNRVAWGPAAALIAGQAAGGFAGSRLSLVLSEQVALRVYLALLLAFALKLVVFR